SSSAPHVRHALVACSPHATAPAPTYALSLHDALPIFARATGGNPRAPGVRDRLRRPSRSPRRQRRGARRRALQFHPLELPPRWIDRKSTRLNSSHVKISYAVFCLKKKKQTQRTTRTSQ